MKRSKKNAMKRKIWRRRNSRGHPKTPNGKEMCVCDKRITAYFYKEAMDKILTQIESDCYHETGLFLIGTLMTDHITGRTVAVVKDAYSDGKFGTASNYTFSSRFQCDTLNYIQRTYGEEEHMIGTVHSHAQFDAFYSTTDYEMMNSRKSEEIHMVLSPSRRTYVLTYKDLDFVYHNDIALMEPSKFRYRRNPQ